LHLANVRGLLIGPSAHGLGLFSTQGDRLTKAEREIFTPDKPVFRKGQKIVEYIGEHLSKEEVEYRYDEFTAPYAIQCGPDDYIDAALIRCAASVANTAPKKQCNCKFITDSHHKVYLQATKDILPGKEILVDYGDEYVISEPNVAFSTKRVRKQDDAA